MTTLDIARIIVREAAELIYEDRWCVGENRVVVKDVKGHWNLTMERRIRDGRYIGVYLKVIPVRVEQDFVTRQINGWDNLIQTFRQQGYDHLDIVEDAHHTFMFSTKPLTPAKRLPPKGIPIEYTVMQLE